ncbi:MAG: hypothetical protein P8N76_23815 [Pirellulaceae bacterium]|nr:hypothetical protein [Pirellulaceae bacterium]
MIRSHRLCLRLSSVALLVGLCATTANAQFSDLIRRVPPGANAVVAVNLQKALASPLASKENWKQDRQKAFEAGMIAMPPSADQLLLAAQMDLQFMQPMWEVTLLNVNRKASMPEIATRWGGTIDNFNGRSAVMLPHDAYIVGFGESMVGSMSPGNRQTVGRWLRQIDSNQGGRLSPYLNKAVNYANKGGTPIIMALDLQDVISPEVVKTRVKQSDFFKQATIDLDKLAKTLASAQGVTLGITIKDRVFGKLKVDFGEDASVLNGIFKPLVLDVLATHSASINEFSDWKPVVKGKTASIEGYLDRSGMRRLLSFIDSPAALGTPQGPISSGQDTEALKISSSQQYFKSITTLLDDLQQDTKSGQAKTMGQVGAWLDRYSRKIDKLPMLNVDPELLDYSAYVSDTLRQASDSLKSIAGRSRVRELNSTEYTDRYAYRGGRWGAYGAYGGVASSTYDRYGTQQARTAARTEERVSGTANARDIMRGVESATTDVRRKMVKKYNAEF